MVKPWTHENIQILKENISDGNLVRPHPYFTTKLQQYKGEILDYCIADDLFHMYPNILALGVVLVEIAAKESFKSDSPHYLWDETTINDYYEWAWVTANRSDLGNMIGAAYKAVVNNCLDAELFRDGSFDSPNIEKDLETRQSLLYEKVVLPLRQLYLAYKDDWEIQEITNAETNIFSQKHTHHSRPTHRSQFTVAIFCALPLEADAARELFDEIWGEGENYGKAAGDANTYTLGKILHHNVVLVHMAGMGKGASQASSSILSSYPEIKLGLVVGICGGVPSYSEGNDDIILGDVVISDGIVQYDFGRQFPDTFSTREGVVSRPPPSIRTMLAKLKGVQVQECVEKTISKNLESLQDKPAPNKKAFYPGTDKDELYKPTYQHKHQEPAACNVCRACEGGGGASPVCEEARTMTCQQLGCQRDSLVPRRRLQEASAKSCAPNPKIHIGPLGSGDTVMKSGQHRDKIATQHNLIAFEMEASGVWDNLPCLVIKGVCDYADSHKNKHWQHYAAVTAAICMKAILGEWVVGG
jgi:nucleoside phosphorylase